VGTTMGKRELGGAGAFGARSFDRINKTRNPVLWISSGILRILLILSIHRAIE